MYELKQLFSQIGSRNEYVKISVFLCIVVFILYAVLGRRIAMIIGAIALIFACLGAAFWLKGLLADRHKHKNLP